MPFFISQISPEFELCCAFIYVHHGSGDGPMNVNMDIVQRQKKTETKVFSGCGGRLIHVSSVSKGGKLSSVRRIEWKIVQFVFQ